MTPWMLSSASVLALSSALALAMALALAPLSFIALSHGQKKDID
eukprot:CAMPEP_0170797746 /NCGR_PEP_ID=MMETSP0733-20121128/25824_1 /TAXON_ID=186038 /ORGANISM="Fragilariopsis kerguelensis, Strain L26-C5" /LENGTH=43 /DNA_ID= /DNA_START= /DNA_END= /DNA_ORIENTATION=